MEGFIFWVCISMFSFFLLWIEQIGLKFIGGLMRCL